MFGIGTPELIFIFLVGFFIFGPRQLPEIGRRLGEIMAQLRRAADDFKQTWEAEVESERLRLARDLSSEVKLPDLAVDLAAPSTTEPEVMPANGALSRTSIGSSVSPSDLPSVEVLPAVDVSDALPVSPAETGVQVADHLPVAASLDTAAPRAVPRPGAMEAVEAIGYEG
ncbi:MAG: twin-arginine translocase TatA/TatE family subunit [Acidobacteriota bacterium]